MDKQCAEYASYFMMIFRTNMRLNLPKGVVTLHVFAFVLWILKAHKDVLFKSKLKHTHTYISYIYIHTHILYVDICKL